MSVRVQLDNPHGFYTNLDVLSGKVILSLSSDEAVNAIVVKLEGESQTMLMRPRNVSGTLNSNTQYYDRNTRGGIATESHKILYKINQVFPSTSHAISMNSSSAYTLKAGQHEYPFKFKIPFNNVCSSYLDPNMPMPLFPFGGQAQQLLYKHVKQTLPPSLSGFPGEAEIRYYVKVTVQRPGIWRENRRGAMGFRFMPMDAPRAPLTGRETFARRQHSFDAGLASYPKKNGLFSKAPKPAASATPPSFQIDARLPEPPILTCHEPVPLRILLKRKNKSPEQLFLISLQIELIGYTIVEAQDMSRKEANTWVIMSSAGLSIPIGSPNDEIDTETVLNSSLWDRIPLPNTVAPTFKTCNLGRIYELEVRVGLGYGTVNNIQPQKVYLPLRFPVQVFSGISPPTALVDRMASRPNANAVPAAQRPAVPPRPSSNNTAAPAPIVSDPLYPPQLGTLAAEDAPDAPPSYEDAMADDIAPIDGPRRSYGGDINTTGESDVGDEKAPKYTPRPGDSGSGSGGGGGRTV